MTVERVRRRLPNRRLFSTSIVALLATLLTLLAFVGVAHAGPGKPIAGRDYVQQGPGDGSFIRIWIKQGARIYAPGLAEVFRTTPKKIRELNPHMTLAICYDPKTQKTHKSPSVTTDVQSRETDEIWKGCAEENQWVYVYSGAFLMIDDPTAKIMEEKLTAEDEAPPKAKPKPPPEKAKVAPAPPPKAPAPPTVAPPAPPAATQRPSDDEVKALKEKLSAANAKLTGLEGKNRELKALTAKAEKRMGALEGEKNDLNALLQEKDGKIATLQASVIPTGARWLFGAALFALVIGLLFVGIKLNGSRGEITNLRAIAESAQVEADSAKIGAASANGEVAQAQEELRNANVAKTQAESAKNASDRARTQLEQDVAQARQVGTDRAERILELEAVEQRMAAEQSSEHTDTKMAYAALLSRLYEFIGAPQDVRAESNLYELSRAILEYMTRHFAKFNGIMPQVCESLKGEQEETVGTPVNDLLHLQMFCQAFGRIKRERDEVVQENAGLRDESVFTAEIIRLEGENEVFLNEIATVNGENNTLKAEVAQLKSNLSALQSAEIVRLATLEERSQAVSELPLPPDPGKDIQVIVADEEAARPAGDSPLHEAVTAATQVAEDMAGGDGDEDMEPIPETISGVVPQAGDLPATPSGRPVRVPTLRQDMSHLQELLIPGSKERTAFFSAAEAVNEAITHSGGLKVTELREISILSCMAQWWIEVFVQKKGIRPVQLKDFADPSLVLTFQPVPT